MKSDKTIIQKRKAGYRSALPYLYIAPFVIAFLLFFVIPAIYSLVLSFFKYKGYGEMNFIGFDNYKSLLNYEVFWKAVRNTFFYFLAHIVPVMVGAFLLALGLRSKTMGKLQSVFKPILFLPQIVPVIATALIFKIIFSTQTGAINQMFDLDITWLDHGELMRWVIVVLVVWRSIGWFMVVFLSGLTTISEDIREAAMLDGASIFQQLTKITLPLMKPFFLFAFIMDAISSFKIYTEPNLLLPAQAKASAEIAPMMNMITKNLSGGNFGLASAAGWLLFIVILAISAVELLMMRNKE